MEDKECVESLQQIGKSIKEHREKEISSYSRFPAVGRANCKVVSSGLPNLNGEKTFWIINNERRVTREAYDGDGLPVYKNTKIGEVLSKYHSGTREYSTVTKTKKANVVTVSIHNRSIYTPTSNAVKEILINVDGDRHTYRFRLLSDLISEHDILTSRLDELKKKQEEVRKAQEIARLAAEKAEKEKAAKEESERLRAEELRRKEEEEKKQAEIKELEKQIVLSRDKIKQAQSFIREGGFLRSQHILDEFQEDAKRSHLYDGTPVVIEGGPGTGKTTTMIQRLKFLISKEALIDYEAPLTKEQINDITDPLRRNANWLFFSPTDKLLGFLRHNMTEEELTANEGNTTTLDTFCQRMLMAYKLRIPDSDGPFKICRKIDGEETIIEDPKSAIKSFEQFLVRRITEILVNISKLSTKDYPWNDIAISIKAYCQRASNIKDIDGLMNLFNALQLNERKKVKDIESRLNKEKSAKALDVKKAIMEDAVVKKRVYELFEKWTDESNISQGEDIGEDELDESEDEEEELATLDFEPMLFKNIKPLLRNMALRKIDSKQKESTRQKELHGIIGLFIDNIEIDELAHLEWFKKNFAFICRGIESNIFNQIPKLYKEFRKEQATASSKIFNQLLLQRIIKKDGGKRIHREELELIIGFINRMVHSVYKRSKVRFLDMKNNKYVNAYVQNVKPVIGIDEATDYSYMDYYFMASFQHYEYSSITLCGDIMQGLNNNGVRSWNELKNIIPNLEIYELKESYRQLPTLLNMSKRLYYDDRGMDAPYTTAREMSPNEPAPICFISDDMEDKAKWMAKRIVEIFKYYGDEMPSVAIFVGDDVKIEELISTMIDQDILNGIPIFDCSDNKTTNTTKCVRVFRLKEVKGMEFEVVLFYDIDQALKNQTHEMMRRYLYVGVSRATSHLAATFTDRAGNEDIIKYFNPDKKDWRM